MRVAVNTPNLTREEMEKLIRQPRNLISVDIETVSLDNRLPLGVAIGISDDVGFYFFDPRDDLLHLMVDNTPLILFQNAKYDIPIMTTLGYTIRRYEDTKLLAYAAGILENSLAELSSSILHRDCPSVTSLWRKKDQGNIAIDHLKLATISITHACNTYMLWCRLPKTQLYKDIDRPSIDLLMEMEKWGILIDQYKLTQVEQSVMVRAQALEEEIKQELGNINLASNPQVAEALREKGVIGTRKTKSGKDAVSEESLKPLNHPLANKILKHRSEMKTLTTYIPFMRSPDSGGRIHTRFGYTDTGRWSSSAPNLQNITRDEKFRGMEDA